MARVNSVVLVGGTWGGDWIPVGAPFRTFLEARGFACLEFEGWSGDVDGLPINPGHNGKHSDWIAGGFALSYFLRGLPYEARNVIAHSHGGQVVAYCAARTHVHLRSLVTVCTPVRKDMEPAYRELGQRTARWHHVSAKGWDFWQRIGEFGDWRLGWTQAMPEAHQNLLIPNIGHSKLLSDPAYFERWDGDGLIDTLRAVRLDTPEVLGV